MNSNIQELVVCATGQSTISNDRYNYELFFFGGREHHFERYKSFYNNMKIRKLAAGAFHQVVLAEDYQLYITGGGHCIDYFEDCENKVLNITGKVCSGHERIVEISIKGMQTCSTLSVLFANLFRVAYFVAHQHWKSY